MFIMPHEIGKLHEHFIPKKTHKTTIFEKSQTVLVGAKCLYMVNLSLDIFI